MASFEPLISVILPNYNHAGCIQQALDGILRQKYQKWEVLVADDASTDGSREVIEANVQKDFRIRAFFSERNRGVCENLNHALPESSGEYVFCAAADDFISDPDFFSDAVEGFSTWREAGVFSGIARMVSAESNEELYFCGETPEEGFLPGREAMRSFVANTFFLHGACTIVRTEWLKQMGFAEGLGPLADLLVFQSAAANHGAIFRRKVYLCVTKAERNFSKGTTVIQHHLFEKRLRELVPDSGEFEKEFEAWRFKKIIFLISSAIQMRSAEGAVAVTEMLSEVMCFYPPLVPKLPSKEALLALTTHLRENVRHPGLRAGIPDLVKIIDAVIRPFYQSEV